MYPAANNKIKIKNAKFAISKVLKMHFAGLMCKLNQGSEMTGVLLMINFNEEVGSKL